MGCCQSSNRPFGQSSNRPRLEKADDSLHCIIARDQKKRRQQGSSTSQVQYKPRQPHPMLQKRQEEQRMTLNDDPTDQPSSSSSRRQSSETRTTSTSSLPTTTVDADKLLFHTAHHNDTIDSQDLKLIQQGRGTADVANGPSSSIIEPTQS